MNMAMRMRGADAASLSRCAVVVSARRGPVGAVASAVFLATTLGAVLYAAQLQAQQGAVHGQAEQQLLSLQRDVEQSRQLQRLSAARSQELERQIDALNRSLRESQQELSFLRSARPGKS